MRRIARFVGMLAALGCFAWSLTNFRVSTFDTGWYRFAGADAARHVQPVCFALLLRAELAEYRKAKKP